MLHGTLQKMIFGVAWGELDLLLVDLPPGTGDVLLSLSQLLKPTGNPPSGSVWKGSSDWKFGTDPLTMIKRDLALTTPLDVTYTVTTTTLEIRFTFSGAGYTNQGRAEQTNGAWVFTFGL